MGTKNGGEGLLKKKKIKLPEEKKLKRTKRIAENHSNVVEDDKNKRSTGNKKRSDKNNNVDVVAASESTTAAEHSLKTRKAKVENNVSRKNKKRKGKENSDTGEISDQPNAEIKDDANGKSDDEATNVIRSEADGGAEIRPRKLKKAGRTKKNRTLSKESTKVPTASSGDVVSRNVYHISSGDNDFSKGMKKWIMEYHQRRPGLKTLQQKIDDFIDNHEEKLAQERIEKDAKIQEGGFTVVEQLKGRKKTTESETGITVGSVAKAAVEGKRANKKSKEIGQDFYRFQKREAQRSEIMMLQSKFEDDKKRIQQLRANRKFRPY